MNCVNCGAPMHLVRHRDYFVCDYCTTFHFPPASHEGVRVLGEPSPTRCPICRIELVAAAVEQIPVIHCPKCRGILARGEQLREIVYRRRRQVRGPGIIPPPLDQSELERRVTCPGCERTMDVHPYYGPGNAVIDSCGHCALVWLDHGELNTIVDAPGRDRR